VVIETMAQMLNILKDFILSGSALVGAYVAVKGLNTWQRQLKGQVDHELARRLLVTLFKYRDALSGVRHPALFAYEMPTPPQNEGRHYSQEEIRYYGTSKAYQTRWDKVQAERTKLYADLLEAEALWGEELKKLFSKLYGLEHELFITVRQYLDLMNPETPTATKDAVEKIRRNKRDILYDDLSEEPDEFKKDIKNAMEQIESYLKPKLMR